MLVGADSIFAIERRNIYHGSFYNEDPKRQKFDPIRHT